MACLVWILLAFSLLQPAVARAEQPEQAPPSSASASTQEDGSEQTLRDALEAYEHGDLELANRLLERVHIERPSARTLRGLGIVAFQQARYADALILFEQSLIHPDKPLDAELRANVQQLIALSRTHLGELVLHVTPPDAQLFIDGGATVYASGTPLTVAVGAHELALRREGYEPKAMSIAIAAASKLSLEVALVKIEAPAAVKVLPVANTPRERAASVNAAAPAQELEATKQRARVMRWSGYASSALAVLALGGALTATAVANDRIGQIEAACRELPGGQCSTADVVRRERDKSLPRLGRIATAGLLVAGAAAATGATLFVLAYRDRGNRETALLLGIQGRF